MILSELKEHGAITASKHMKDRGNSAKKVPDVTAPAEPLPRWSKSQGVPRHQRSPERRRPRAGASVHAMRGSASRSLVYDVVSPSQHHLATYPPVVEEIRPGGNADMS